MKKKNVIETIKALFTTEQAEVETNFVDVTLPDGRIMRVDALEVDASIKEIIEGEEVDVESGEYELEDGTMITITDGIITEIKEVEAEESEEAESTEELSTEEVEEDVPSEVITKENYSGVSAYIELPVGVHTIEDKVYTVVETVYNEGTDDEWIVNEIETIEDVEGEAVEAPEADEEMSETDLEFVENFTNFMNEFKDLKADYSKLSERFEKFAKEPSEENTKTRVEFPTTTNNKEETFIQKYVREKKQNK